MEGPLSTNESEDYERMMELGFSFDELEESIDSQVNVRPIIPYTMQDLNAIEGSNIEYICIMILCIVSLARFPGEPGKEILRRFIKHEDAVVFFSGLVRYLVYQRRISIDDHHNSSHGIVTMKRRELNVILCFIMNGMKHVPGIPKYCDILEKQYLNKARVVAQLEKIYIGDSSVSVYFRR